MFRRTAADLDRVKEMLAGGATGDDVANRLTLEGMPRQRAGWLVWRAKQERRFFQFEKPPRQVDWDPRGIAPEELAAPPPRNVRVARPIARVSLMIVGIALIGVAIGAYEIRRGDVVHPLRDRVMIAAGLALLVMLPYLHRTAKRQERIDLDLATNGAVAVGEVLGFRMPFFRVRYRFQGVESEASLRVAPSFLPQPGDRIVIVYDPADPGRNAPVDALNVEFV